MGREPLQQALSWYELIPIVIDKKCCKVIQPGENDAMTTRTIAIVIIESDDRRYATIQPASEPLGIDVIGQENGDAFSPCDFLHSRYPSGASVIESKIRQLSHTEKSGHGSKARKNATATVDAVIRHSH
jgi:hypothetical protein